jgi:hypothetical protein
MITIDAMLMNDRKREDMRRSLILAHLAVVALARAFPDNWREKIAEAGRREFEATGATVADYERSLRAFEDSIC